MTTKNTAEGKMVDVTDMTDAVFDVFMEAKGGADFVDCAHLNAKERGQLAKAMGWENNARTRHWVNDAPASPPVSSRRVRYIDYEQMILEEQDERFQD